VLTSVSAGPDIINTSLTLLQAVGYAIAYTLVRQLIYSTADYIWNRIKKPLTLEGAINKMAKTYIPSAVDIATHTHKYLSRYQAKMTIGATTDQIAALSELIACLAVFLSKWFKPVPTT
jgi:hypothetical protein